VKECILRYDDMCKQIFGSKHTFRGCRYYHTKLERQVEILLEKQRLSKTTLMRDDSCRPKTFTVAVEKDTGQFSPLCSYVRQSDRVTDCIIVQAALATSAAPWAFNPASIKSKIGSKIDLIDGGVGHNNPANDAIIEAKELWPDNNLGVIVSIGNRFCRTQSISPI